MYNKFNFIYNSSFLTSNNIHRYFSNSKYLEMDNSNNNDNMRLESLKVTLGDITDKITRKGEDYAGLIEKIEIEVEDVVIEDPEKQEKVDKLCEQIKDAVRIESDVVDRLNETYSIEDTMDKKDYLKGTENIILGEKSFLLETVTEKMETVQRIMSESGVLSSDIKDLFEDLNLMTEEYKVYIAEAREITEEINSLIPEENVDNNWGNQPEPENNQDSPVSIWGEPESELNFSSDSNEGESDNNQDSDGENSNEDALQTEFNTLAEIDVTDEEKPTSESNQESAMEYTTEGNSSGKKRKYDESENISDNNLESSTNTKRLKVDSESTTNTNSLLDDFADTSTEPADYFGGDD